MRLLLTGAYGFIGRNLQVMVGERAGWSAMPVTRTTSPHELRSLVQQADAVVHLAGVNRPPDPAGFEGNRDATRALLDALRESGRVLPLLFASSVQAERDNPYGRSKRDAERLLAAYAEASGGAVAILRLPNVFGKWCRPEYNSVVATFCHRIARGEPIEVHDPAAPLTLAYIDDVVAQVIAWAASPTPGVSFLPVNYAYATTVGQVAAQIRAFGDVRRTLVTERVGTGLVRALYATYISYLPTAAFSYPLPRHSDARGVFVEMLKTPDSGQFSYFTAHPGVTRGGHYHHSKSEKFLVIKGAARFRFRNLANGERYELDATGDQPMVVETIPGWSHDITNTGQDELVVMLWANEIFDRARPDTIASPV